MFIAWSTWVWIITLGVDIGLLEFFYPEIIFKTPNLAMLLSFNINKY